MLCVTVVVGLHVQTAKFHKFLGNGFENIAYVNETTDANDFTFIVTGDVKGGTATFEWLLNFSQLDKPAFIVVLGDFVSNPDLIRHKLFAVEMAEYAQHLPMFLVPGNHDINPDSAFRLKDFEAVWGPAQFQFTIGKNLFIFLNNAPPYNKTVKYLKFLEEVLLEQAEKAEKIFVFMHVPPSGLDSSLMCNGLAGSEKFFELAKKYNIDYVFAGDHHGYVKTERDGTTFIVTGGGGARLRGSHGRFHHVIRIEVKNGTVTETVFAGKKQLETLELIEHNMVVYLWPVITQNFVSISITVLLFGAIIWLMIFSVRRRKQLKNQKMKD
jgi:predicted MPP superfamily phosphohydrolase